MAKQNHATWSDLPTEIIQEILAVLDPPSLLALSKLNHYLNYVALEIFFGVALYRISHAGVLVPPSPHDETLTLRAYYLAFWLEHIVEIEQWIYGDVRQSLQQFYILISLVARLQSLKSLKLRITLLAPCWGWRNHRVEGEHLITMLHELVEVAMSKGCEKLHIEGNSFPHCGLSASGIRALRSPEAMTARTFKWMKQCVSFPCVSLPDESPPPSPLYEKFPDKFSTSSGSHITSCILSRPALLGSTALPFIAKLLRRNARTITHLEMNCFGLTRSWWKARALSFALFSGITLPHLTTLILHIQVSTISTSNFAWFLSRHSELSTLEMHDPSTLPEDTSMIISRHQPLSLPNMKILRIPARVADWIFANETESLVLDTLEVYACSHPDGFGKLGDAIHRIRCCSGHIQNLTLHADWWQYGNDLTENQNDRLNLQDLASDIEVQKLCFIFEVSFLSTLSTPMCPTKLAGGFVNVMRLFPSVKALEMRFGENNASVLEGLGTGEMVRKKITEEFPDLCVLSVLC